MLVADEEFCSHGPGGERLRVDGDGVVGDF